MLAFKYKVKYISGPSNIADSLSRLIPNESREECSSDNVEEYIQVIAAQSTPVAITIEIERVSGADEELGEVRDCLKTGKWYKLIDKRYLPIRYELSGIGQLILRGTRIVIPVDLRDEVLQVGHEAHPGIVIMKQRLCQKVWWPNMDRDIEKYCESCQLVSKPEYPEPMKRRKLPSAPWEHLCIDFLGPLPSGQSIFGSG